MSLNNPQPAISVPLAGACICVMASLPFCGLAAVLFGETYSARLYIYCGSLLWAVLGAILVFWMTRKSEQVLGLRWFFLWFVSVWLWPIPFLMHCLRRAT